MSTKKASIGDRVVCIYNGGSYRTYDSFFKYYGLENLLPKYEGHPLTEGRVYAVLYRFKHTSFEDIVLVLEDIWTGKIFLCKDSPRYLYTIHTGNREWSEKSKARICKIMENYDLIYRFIEGGYLFVDSTVYSNVPRMSTKRLEELLDALEKDVYWSN